MLLILLAMPVLMQAENSTAVKQTDAPMCKMTLAELIFLDSATQLSPPNYR
jgi:hypothetical protein